MANYDMPRRLAAEAVGTGFLLAAVVGSGIMAERLAGGSAGLALLTNAIPTGAILVVIILIFGPVSGAHFNPAVSVAFMLRRELTVREGAAYILFQIGGGIAGTWCAHAMFAEPLLMFSTTARSGAGQWLGEVVATFGLVSAILGCVRFRPEAVAYAVGLYITSAYWFTSSTSFANPAVTIARTLTDTFAGIHPPHAPAFIFAQILGAVLATGFFAWLLKPKPTPKAQAGLEPAGTG